MKTYAYQTNAIKCCKCYDRSLRKGPWGWQRRRSWFSPILTLCSTHPCLLDEGIDQQIACSRRFQWENDRKGKKSTYPPTMLWDKETNWIKESKNGVSHLCEQHLEAGNWSTLKLIVFLSDLALRKIPRLQISWPKQVGQGRERKREGFLSPTPEELNSCPSPPNPRLLCGSKIVIVLATKEVGRGWTKSL